MAAEPTIHYLAYGSNLDPGTFLGRRRLHPLQSRVAQLAGYSLVFDLAVGSGERAVANVRKAPGDHLFGVVYELTLPEAEHLDRTEGVGRGGYRRIAVQVEVAGEGAQNAYTLESGRRRPGRKPSRRYMGLLLKGAAFHGLPSEWVARLRAFELAVDERSGQGELFGHPRTSETTSSPGWPRSG
jgi:hypothetical protein